MSKIIVDTGPLVAFLVRSDSQHSWAVERFKELSAPFITCEPVLTETAFLLSKVVGGVARFFELLATGLLVVKFDLFAERDRLRTLMHKYAQMSLADACLVRMTETEVAATVFTLDSDFRTYRRNGRQLISLVAPD